MEQGPNTALYLTNHETKTNHVPLHPCRRLPIRVASSADRHSPKHFTEGKQVPPTTEKLKAGDFVWEPERSAQGRC